jgi:tetratricopeptide (TPR) repeat protein
VTESIGAQDRSSEVGFGGHLIIDGVTGDRDLLNVTFVDMDGRVTGPVSMSLPLHDLGHTGLIEVLARDDHSGVAACSKAYGRVLRLHLRAALDGLAVSEASSADSFGTKELPLLVSIAGPPRVHQVMWEALDADELPRGGPGVLVVHLPKMPGAIPGCDLEDRTQVRLGREAAGPARLRWIGARPFPKDLPRYLIAGPVANRVLASDALSFDVLRTNATADEALALVPHDAPESLITHLDVHGASRMRAGEETGLIAEPEFAAFFPEGESYKEIPDQTIADAATASGCFMFVTNACFGAQQRELGQWPFPARLVRGGCKLAIAAKDPLDGNAAMLFFTAFYGALAASESIGRAYRDARRLLTMHPAGQESAARGDLSSRYALQPVLWASSVEDLAVYFHSREEHPADGRTRAREVSRLMPYIEAARLDEGFARFIETLEDLHWSGAPAGQVESAPRCDLDGRKVTGVVTEIRRVFGTQVVRAAKQSGGAVSAASAARGEGLPDLVFPEFTDLERFLLVSLRFIGEPNPLRELLGLAVHAEAPYLDYLERASAGDVAQALLLALSWGDASAHPVPLSATTQNAEQIIDAECRRAVDDKDRPELLGRALADAHRIDCALPVVTLDADEFMDVSAPRLWTIPRHYLKELSLNGAYRVLAFEETNALEMRRRDQVAMRQRMKPEAVVVADQLRIKRQPEALKLGENARWNDGTKRVCAAWLAIAVAYRQVGLINPLALRATTFILNLVDRGVAVLLSRALTTGLPGWPPLADPSIADQYQQETALWQRLHHDFDDSDELDAPSDTTRYAMALMHAGRHSEALEVSERLIRWLQPVAHDTDMDNRNDVISTHAYILARNGRVKEALALAVPEIRNLGQLSLYQQCEFLHLLGDLMHYQEKFAAAIRYFLQERGLRPPALHRRLHNRSHLLGLLIRNQQDPDLIAQIAVEGLMFAYEAQAASEVEKFAATLVDYVHLLSEEQRQRILDGLQGKSAPEDRPAAAVVSIALKTTPAERLDAQQRAVLESQLGTAGALRAFACFRLASQPDAPIEEKVRLLRVAVEEASQHGHYCRLALLDALWDAEDWHGLGEHATRIRPTYPTSGEVHAALGASAYQDGRRSDAIEALARAFCYARAFDILRRTPKLLLMLREADGLSQEVDARTMSMLVEVASQLEDGMDTAGTVLPGLSLIEVIDRIYDYNKYAEPLDHRVIDTLIAMSERAWDRADYPVAINARRRACQLIESTGDNTARLAMELGWLATLVKQAGNVEEALSLYQRAIAAGSDSLHPGEESSLLGRYANLLHQIGAYEPAVRTQWLAVLAQKPEFRSTENSFPPAPETLDAALDPNGLDTTALARWPLLAANFANCLESAGHHELAAQALRAALTAVNSASSESPAIMANPNGAQFKRLFQVVRANVEAQGIDVTSIPVPNE